jgi:hypothetical protein
MKQVLSCRRILKKTIYISPGKSDIESISFANKTATIDNLNFTTANKTATFDNVNFTTANKTATFDNVNFTTANKTATFDNMNFSNTNKAATIDNLNFTTANEAATIDNLNFSTANETVETDSLNILKVNYLKVFGSVTKILIQMFRLLTDLKGINVKDRERRVFKSGTKSQELMQFTFVKEADKYLHYANGIIFFICNIRNASEVIAIKICTAADMIRILLIKFESAVARRTIYFILKAEIANAFDGVIERYCGVPP